MKKRKKTILAEIKKVLQTELNIGLGQVILFGSRAWGKPRKDSDYDLLVILHEQDTWQIRDRISACLYEIDLMYEICTQPIVISENDLLHSLRGKQAIFQKALEKGIYL